MEDNQRERERKNERERWLEEDSTTCVIRKETPLLLPSSTQARLIFD
jgi:hypothetical protein